MFRKKSGMEKIRNKRGRITNFRRKLYVSQCLKTSWGALHCFRQFRVFEIFMHNKLISLFSIEYFLSHSAGKNCKATPPCFRNFLAWRKFYEKEGGIKFFRLIFFVSQYRKVSYGPLCFRNVLVSKIFMHSKRGITVLSIFFVSQDRNEKKW